MDKDKLRRTTGQYEARSAPRCKMKMERKQRRPTGVHEAYFILSGVQKLGHQLQ